MRHGLFPLSAALALVSANAFAGVVVTSTSTDLSTKQSSPSVIYADADKMKVVNATTTVIFRGDQQKAWIIFPGQKTYMEMTPESMRQMSGQLAASRTQLDAMQARMQQQLATMPPAQRAQMEALLGARGGAGALPQVGQGRGGPAAQTGTLPQLAYTKAGPARTVSNMRCDNYRRTNNGVQDEDICITPIATARLTATDFQVLDRFAKFMEPVSSSTQMSAEADVMSWNAMNRAIGFQGLPIDTVRYANGTPTRQETVQKIERINIPANTYDLPPGLTKREMGASPPR